MDSILKRIEAMEKAIEEVYNENTALWSRVEDFEDEVEAAREAGDEEDVKKFTKKLNAARTKAERTYNNLEFMRGYLEGLKEAEDRYGAM